MKTQFDEMTRRTWPNPELSERVRFTKEYVLSQFWQTFVRQVRPGECHTDQCSVFLRCGSDGHNWEMGKKLSRVQVRSMHVDLHQGRDLQRSKKHARIKAPQIQIHDMEAVNLVLTTCGKMNAPSFVSKQKFWKLQIATSESHVWCSGACCASHHRQVSIGSF